MRIISAGVWFCPNNTSLFKCSHTSWLSVITNEERQGTWGCSWGASVWGVSIESTCIVGSSRSTFTAKHIWHLNGGGRRACLFSLCKEDNCFQIISAPVCYIAPVSCLLYPTPPIPDSCCEPWPQLRHDWPDADPFSSSHTSIHAYIC